MVKLVKKIKIVSSVGGGLTSSLNTYDLKKLFCAGSSSSCARSGGESMVADDDVDDDHSDQVSSDSDNDKVMSDSISSVSWDDITNDNDDNDDESRD